MIYGVLFLFFFFKQKTAYEMRISDWSSDVCSSDLERQHPEHPVVGRDCQIGSDTLRPQPQIGMAQHHPLGPPGRTAGIEDGGKIAGLGERRRQPRERKSVVLGRSVSLSVILRCLHSRLKKKK